MILDGLGGPYGCRREGRVIDNESGLGAMSFDDGGSPAGGH